MSRGRQVLYVKTHYSYTVIAKVEYYIIPIYGKGSDDIEYDIYLYFKGLKPWQTIKCLRF
ncbi:hypothetical protein SBDP1_840004 [Syntrophobacter sp. SbD1]|nr:hypothetical protein SBDP1_840004 [Syntrophobacter sp. SbD1]